MEKQSFCERFFVFCAMLQFFSVFSLLQYLPAFVLTDFVIFWMRVCIKRDLVLINYLKINSSNEKRHFPNKKSTQKTPPPSSVLPLRCCSLMWCFLPLMLHRTKVGKIKFWNWNYWNEKSLEIYPDVAAMQQILAQ